MTNANPPIDAITHRRHGLFKRSPGERSVDAIFSTGSVDSFGEAIDQASWRLERFAANPVVLWSHDSYGLPIGKAEDVRVDGSVLRGRITFATAQANPLAERVWQGVSEGSLNAVSIGFKPGRSVAEDRNGQQVRVLTDCELFEVSVVPLPANPDAVMLRALGMAPAPAPLGTSPRSTAPTKPWLTPFGRLERDERGSLRIRDRAAYERGRGDYLEAIKAYARSRPWASHSTAELHEIARECPDLLDALRPDESA